MAEPLLRTKSNNWRFSARLRIQTSTGNAGWLTSRESAGRMGANYELSAQDTGLLGYRATLLWLMGSGQCRRNVEGCEAKLEGVSGESARVPSSSPEKTREDRSDNRIASSLISGRHRPRLRCLRVVKTSKLNKRRAIAMKYRSET